MDKIIQETSKLKGNQGDAPILNTGKKKTKYSAICKIMRNWWNFNGRK